MTAFVYDLPVGRGKLISANMGRVVDSILGGWEVSGIVRLSSGLPVRLTAPSLISQYGFGTQYPNLTSADAVSLPNRSPDRWFNTAAFSAPAPYAVGNSPRRLNQLRAGSQHNADVAVLKNFHYGERISIQFRAEAFNLANTPQFGWPDTTFGSPTFEVVSSTLNVGFRNVQFGLKVDF